MIEGGADYKYIEEDVNTLISSRRMTTGHDLCLRINALGKIERESVQGSRSNTEREIDTEQQNCIAGPQIQVIDNQVYYDT